MRTGPSVSRRASIGLAVVLTCVFGPAAGRALAAAPVAPRDPVVVDSPTPSDSPTDQPSPTPTQVDPPPVSPTPDGAPPTVTPVLRVVVSTTNAVLDFGYWSGRTATSLTVTAVNRGTVTESVRLRLTLPAGVALGPAGSCRGSCTMTLAPGRQQSVRVNLTVSRDAWRTAPLTGQLAFVASAPRAKPAIGSATWGVVFPPGPPTPGIALQVDNVALGPQPNTPGQLTVRVGNTGHRTATGSVTVVVPVGVTFGTPAANCQVQGQVKPLAMVCGIGRVAAGGRSALTVSLLVSPRALADSPLAGLVRAALAPDRQRVVSTQASYQIIAAPGQAGVSAGNTVAPAAAGTSAADLLNRAASYPFGGHSAMVWPIIAGSLALLVGAMVGIVLTLRRRRAERARGEARDEPEPVPDKPVVEHAAATAVISAGPVDRTPTPHGPIAWEWIEATDTPDK